MKKRICYLLTAALTMTFFGTSQAFAAEQTYNFAASYTQDSYRIGKSSNLDVSVDTEFAGEPVLKFQLNTEVQYGKDISVDFYGPDVNGQQLSIGSQYAVIDYYWHSPEPDSALATLSTYFQVNNYYDADGKKLDVGSSGFQKRENGINANEWAPMILPLTDEKSAMVRENNPGGYYGTFRLYPVYQGARNAMSTKDILYMKDVTFYSERPSNRVYSPKVEFDGGILKATARLYQFQDAQKGAVAVLAQFDEGGKLIQCKIKEYTADQLVQNAFNDISLTMQYGISGSKTAKLMIVNSLDLLEPLCSAAAASYSSPSAYGNDNELAYPDWFTAVQTAMITD